MVRVQTNNGEVAVLMEDDGKTVYPQSNQCEIERGRGGGNIP